MMLAARPRGQFHLLAKNALLHVARRMIVEIIEPDFAVKRSREDDSRVRRGAPGVRALGLSLRAGACHSGVNPVMAGSAKGIAASNFSGPGPDPIASKVVTPAARARSSIASRSSANCGKSICALRIDQFHFE